MTRAENAAYWDDKCREMIGQRYGKLVVTEYVGVRPHRSGCRVRFVIARCDCGSEYTYEASRLRTGETFQCRKCKQKRTDVRERPENHLTLCWKCAKSTNRFLCPWADGIPRDDWDAMPTTKDDKDTFCVVKCPAFVRG